MQPNNESAINFIKQYNADNGYNTDLNSIFDTLTEANTVYKESKGNRRWWKDVFNVVEIQGRFIGYDWAESTGDESPTELGWSPNANSIYFCEPVEVTITKYKKI